MGKNLKRQNDGFCTTPGVSRQGGKPPMSIGSKRHKQMSLVPFLRTPAAIEETPALQAKLGKAGISSTGLHKLGQLKLRTHQKQQPTKESSAAYTQGRPAAQADCQRQNFSPASDDGFFISMSQTYERTQPEPCCDYGSAEREEVELSLRRTQQYHVNGSTQSYNQPHHRHHHHHHHELLIVTVAAALDHAHTSASATSTADAFEASALGAGASSATTVLNPSEIILEGQASSQPEHLVDLMAAGAVRGRSQSQTRLWPVLDLQRQLPAASSGPAQTPELAVVGVGSAASDGVYGPAAGGAVADDGTTPTLQVCMPLFPIFTQGRAVKTTRRPIHLIRHGESEYNLACKRRGGFGDPSDIFDARLTATGEKQARALRPQLMELMQQHGDPLFIVSPLSRAIETFLLMLPDPERLKVYPQTPPPPGSRSSSSQPTQTHVQRTSRLLPGTSEGEGTAGSSCVNGASAVVASLASRPVNMVICPMLSEFLHTTGDVGRPKSVLIESYPQIADQLRKGLEEERWWYENPSKGPNCAMNRLLSRTEPEKTAKARVDRFRQFVLSQSNRPIVVVGHANFFRTLTHDHHYMSNCQTRSELGLGGVQ